jgi:adenosylhomocysteine nucleosidase
MHVSTIGLIAAMPEEINPLLKRIGAYEKSKAGHFTVYRFHLGDKKAVLIRSGMGTTHAAAATTTLIAAAAPQIILNFGFAGAVTAGPGVADLVLAEQIHSYDGTRFATEAGPSATLVDRMQAALSGQSVYRSTFITTLKIVGKGTLQELLPDDCSYPAVEMETAAVAATAAGLHIPFVALRAISDGADEELGFSLDEFTDSEMNIRLTRVLKTIARKPWIVPQLLRLAQNSSKAGKSLAQGVETLVKAL